MAATAFRICKVNKNICYALYTCIKATKVCWLCFTQLLINIKTFCNVYVIKYNQVTLSLKQKSMSHSLEENYTYLTFISLLRLLFLELSYTRFDIFYISYCYINFKFPFHHTWAITLKTQVFNLFLIENFHYLKVKIN